MHTPIVMCRFSKWVDTARTITVYNHKNSQHIKMIYTKFRPHNKRNDKDMNPNLFNAEVGGALFYCDL